MKENPANTAWIEANQAFLVAEFKRLKTRLSHKPEECPEGPATAAPAVMEPAAAIDVLSEAFGLSTFERAVLLLCAGVEMDSALAAQCAEANGHPQKEFVSFGLALAVLPEPHWSALTPARPLRRFRLVEMETNRGLASAPLRIDERILHYLAGINTLDNRLQSLLQASPRPDWIAEEHQSVAAQAARLLDARWEALPVIQLSGDDSQGQEDAAAFAAQKIGRRLFALRTEELPPLGPDLDQFVRLWEREIVLLAGALLIQVEPGGFTPAARYLTERLCGPLFVAAREPVRLSRPCQRLDVDKPPAVSQKRLWERVLGCKAATFNGTLDVLSDQFRLSARTIFTTGALAAPEQSSLAPGELWNACRSLARPRLDDLAQRIVSTAGWEDLVLPELQKQTLHQIVAQVRHRMKVYETWGFSAKGRRGLGVSALFTGESGTGKTLAGEVLAHELGLDLYRIDLSAVVSKYIGETEKNLKQVFDAAEEGGVLLLFDEADALFGKRSDVKDSHDRYANIEVSYLLQRMEAFQGLAILTTNLKSSLDRAFQRRLRFIVNFPFPDAAQRQEIWSRIFPAKAPTRELDSRRLSQLNVAGGNIRNIAVNAAFLAAEEGNGQAVEMKHLVRAARFEAEKIERPLSEAETRGWI
jgi:AAA+ superfamily predicted ATPase